MASLPRFAVLRSASAVRLVQFAVIAMALVAAAVQTLPERPPAQALWPRIVLWGCLLYFVVEWASHALAAMRAGQARTYWSAPFLVDVLAVVPIPLALAAGVPPATAWLLASLWLFKIAVVTPGIARVGRVISLEAKPLASILLIYVTILFLASVALHLAERNAQPAAFGHLPDSLWWGIVTITNTGYGDAVPVTPLGRIIAGLVMISGIGVFGLLTGILATGFVEDSRRDNFVRNWQLVNNVPFFRVLDPAGITEISRLLRRWDVAEGTTVIRRGREGDCMYFIASGEVEVEVEPAPVRLGPGAFFGELALLGDGVRNATVTTTMPSTLLILEVADFRMFTAHHAALADAIETEARRRARARADRTARPASQKRTTSASAGRRR